MFYLLTADVIPESDKFYTATKVAGPHSTKCGTDSAVVMPSMSPMALGEAPRVTEPKAVS
jgi:hypothetical protein